MALTVRFRMPELLPLRQKLPPEHPQFAAVLPMQLQYLGHSGQDFRISQAAADDMVSSDVSTDTDKEYSFSDAVAPAVGNFLLSGVAYEVQIMQVMMERNRSQPLSGFVQLDDTYLRGERSGDGQAEVEERQFCWVKTVLGILMSVLRSTYHSFQSKFTQRYLAEFEYRFKSTL